MRRYRKLDKPFILTEKSFMDLYEEGMDYFHEEVLSNYTDVVIEDPMEGIRLAFGDFLSNDSPLQDESGEYLSWGEAIGLGKRIYDLSGLDEKTKMLGPGSLAVASDAGGTSDDSAHEIEDWLEGMCEDGSPEYGRYMVFGGGKLFARLLEKLEEIDLDSETMCRIGDEYWNEWYSVRDGIIRDLADEVLKEMDA